MLTQQTIMELQSSNICRSSDKEKLLNFMDAYWKNASPAIKSTAVRFGGYENNKAFNTCKATGRISVRMCVALAQTFNVSPYYIIGRAEEPGHCTDELLKQFLIDQGFRYIVDRPENETIASGTVSAQENNSAETEEESILVNTLKGILEVFEQEPMNINLTKENAKILLEGLYIKAESGNSDAENKLNLIKAVLTA